MEVLKFKKSPLKEMMDEEYKALKDNVNIQGRIPSDILIAIKFTDGHIHTVLPGIEATSKLNSTISVHLSDTISRKFRGY
jgi:hypothetical protein